MEEVRIWETFNCKDIEEIIKGNLRTIDEKFAQIASSFVTNGYYLRRQHDEKMYEAEGYSTFEEYVKAVYGKSRSWAKRMMQINEKFSIGGNNPRIDSKYVEYSVSQLQEMLYLEEEQLEQVTPDMTIKEIREVRKIQEEIVEEEPVSILGYPLRVYPEGSLVSTPGCWKCDCYSCHRDGCELRQEECYCVEAPMGSQSFPCTTLHIVENLRQEVGNRCQFVNEDLAFHRAGDEQPVPCCKKCNNPCGYECRRSVKARQDAKEVEKEKLCDVAQNADDTEEEQIPGQMNVEDYPELLPEEPSHGAGEINHGADENKIPSGQQEVVIDADYEEVVEEDEIHYSEIAIRDYLEEEERTLAEYEKVNAEDGGLPHNLMMRQRMLVKALRLLMEHESDQDEENHDELEEAEMDKGKEFMSCARNSLSNLNCEIEHKAWKAALASSRHLTHYINLVINENTEQPELPVLRNNDQRKEFLNSFHDWPVWFEVPEASEVYYRFDLPDESSVVICEYRMWISWKERYTDENPDSTGTREYLLKSGYRYLEDCKTNTSALIEHLKNIQKGEKK